MGGLQGLAERVRPAPAPTPPAIAGDAAAVPARRSGAVLEVEGVAKAFGGLRVLEDVSFELHRSSVLALIGTNGAGKTTCFNLVSGLLAPDAGRIRIAGLDVTGLRPDRRARLGMGRTFQDLRLFGDRTVLDNVLVGAHRHSRVGFASAGLHLPAVRADERELRARAWRALELVGIPDLAGRVVGDQPFARQRLVDLARALASEPTLLLLDEPSSGLSTAETEELRRLLARVAETGVAILLVEHNMALVSGLADEVIVLAGGRVVFRGDPDAALTDDTVLESYLGAATERGPV
jgi:branched-chain amino acid transport system permease protein